MTDVAPSARIAIDADGSFSVGLRRHLAHPPERVWRALTDPTELARWFVPAEVDPHPGGRLRLDFGAEGITTGEVLVCDPPRVLEHTWECEGRVTVVRFELHPDGDGTRLELAHRGGTRADAIDHAAGWQVWWDRLPAWLDGADPAGIEDRYPDLLDHHGRVAPRLRVEETCRIAAEPSAVWEALAGAIGRSRWWPDLELEATPGGRLLERWHDGDGRPRVTRGRVVEANPAERLRTTWVDEDWDAETEVEIALAPSGEGTSVTVTHTGWHHLADAGRLWAQHRDGWRRHLDRLRATLEGTA